MGGLFGLRRSMWPIRGRDWRFPFLTFFAHWLRNPGAIGSVVPSGRALGEALTRQIPSDCPGPIVELGGGTGSITSALLRGGIKASDLVVVEREFELCELIRSRFPSVTVIEDDVKNLPAILAAHGYPAPRAIVSSLPLLSIGRDESQLIVERAFGALDDEGIYLQYTYGPGSPVPSSTVEALGLSGRRLEWVVGNLPPAAVWRYEKSASVSEAASASGV